MVPGMKIQKGKRETGKQRAKQRISRVNQAPDDH